MSESILKYRDDFPNLKTKIHGKNLIYFDNAATTLKPNSVIEAVQSHYHDGTSNVHRGVHLMSQEATLKFEDARSRVQHFLGAEHAYEIIFTSGTTESINLVAQTYGESNLKNGDEILISYLEHHSNIVPWQILCEKTGAKLKVAPVDNNGDIDFEQFENLLSERTKIVAFNYISNALGTINPVDKMIKSTRAKSPAVVLIDAAQAAAHLSINVVDLDCDFLAFSAHKTFGPTGVGVLYGKKDLLNSMPPWKGGGDMIETVTFEKTTYNLLPHKFEAGTPHIAGVIGLGEAIKYIDKVGLENIAQYEDQLLNYAHDTMGAIDGLSIVGTAKKKASVVSFVLKDIHPHDIGTFCDQDGIAVRTGHHCTQPLMARFGVPATARASFSFYNTKEEIDVLVNNIKKTMEFFK